MRTLATTTTKASRVCVCDQMPRVPSFVLPAQHREFFFPIMGNSHRLLSKLFSPALGRSRFPFTVRGGAAAGVVPGLASGCASEVEVEIAQKGCACLYVRAMQMQLSR